MLEEIGKKHKIASNEDIRNRIAYLEKLKTQQEDVLKLNLIDVHKSLQPMELIKTAIDKIRDDNEIGEKAGGLIGSLSLNYIIGKVFRHKATPAGFVKSLVVQQIASFLYKKNEKRINGFVGNLTKKALRKLHVLEDQEPEELLEEQEEKLDAIEEEEDHELAEAKVAGLKESQEEKLYEKDDPRVEARIDNEEDPEKEAES